MIKPGYKTTEFLLVALVIIGQLTATLAGVLPARWAALATTASAAAYAISRAVTKWNEPKAATAKANRDAISEVGAAVSSFVSLLELMKTKPTPAPRKPRAKKPAAPA